jgi:hypothetical protein
MAGKYYVLANEDEGGRWSFTEDQIRKTAAEIRPDATVFGPEESPGAWIIELPGTTRSTHEVVYLPGIFSFREEDAIDVTAGFVFRFLQRLAPDVPTCWVADFDGEIYPLRVADQTEADFVRELWSI